MYDKKNREKLYSLRQEVQGFSLICKKTERGRSALKRKGVEKR